MISQKEKKKSPIKPWMNNVSQNAIIRVFWEKHVLIINVRHNNLVFYLLITGKNNSIPSSSESNDEKPEGSGNNQTNHENVLDMETKNNMSMTKSSLIRKMDSILSALPICRDIPSRIHVEV